MTQYENIQSFWFLFIKDVILIDQLDAAFFRSENHLLFFKQQQKARVLFKECKYKDVPESKPKT